MPTSSQVSVALDLLEAVANKPSAVPPRLLERATQIVDDAMSTAMWNGKDGAGGAAYGQLPQLDEATVAKLEAFDKVARLLFCYEGDTRPTWSRDKGITGQALDELKTVVAPHVPELA